MRGWWLLLLAASAASAEEARPVVHDGVTMNMTKSADDNGLEIAFGADVPPALKEVGVTSGTMLIRGTWEENILIGEAWAFSKECKPISYAIRGVVDYGGSLVVFGPMPTTCKADDYAAYSWGKEAVMRFDQPQPALTYQEDRKGKQRKAKREQRAEEPKPKAKPKPAPKPRAAPRPTYQQPQQQQWPGYPQQWRW